MAFFLCGAGNISKFLRGFCHSPKNFLTAVTFGLIIYSVTSLPAVVLRVRKASVVGEPQPPTSAANILPEVSQLLLKNIEPPSSIEPLLGYYPGNNVKLVKFHRGMLLQVMNGETF